MNDRRAIEQVLGAAIGQFGSGWAWLVKEADKLKIVTTGNAETPITKGARALILHTCEFAEGNTWAKRIAEEAIRVLGGEDEVGLLD